jgi:hypothetical protein
VLNPACWRRAHAAVRTLIALVITSITVLTTSTSTAHAVDIDGNEIDDGDEIALAERFCPALQLHGPETTRYGISTPVYPVPVEIIALTGAEPGDGLTAEQLAVSWWQQARI